MTVASFLLIYFALCVHLNGLRLWKAGSLMPNDVELAVKRMNLRRTLLLKYDNDKSMLGKMFPKLDGKDSIFPLDSLTSLHNALDAISNNFYKFNYPFKKQPEPAANRGQRSRYSGTAPGQEMSPIYIPKLSTDNFRMRVMEKSNEIFKEDLHLMGCYNNMVDLYDFFLQIRSGEKIMPGSFLLFWKRLQNPELDTAEVKEQAMRQVSDFRLLKTEIDLILETQSFSECFEILNHYSRMDTSGADSLLKTLESLSGMIGSRLNQLDEFIRSNNREVMEYNDVIDELMIPSDVPPLHFPLMPDAGSIRQIATIQADSNSALKLNLFNDQIALIGSILPFSEVIQLINGIPLKSAIDGIVEPQGMSSFYTTATRNKKYLCLMLPSLLGITVNIDPIVAVQTFPFTDDQASFALIKDQMHELESLLFNLLSTWHINMESPVQEALDAKSALKNRLISTKAALEAVTETKSLELASCLTNFISFILQVRAEENDIPYLLSTTSLFLLKFDSNLIINPSYDAVMMSDLTNRIISGILSHVDSHPPAVITYAKEHVLLEVQLAINDIFRKWEDLLTRDSISQEENDLLQVVISDFDVWRVLLFYGPDPHHPVSFWLKHRNAVRSESPENDSNRKAYRAGLLELSMSVLKRHLTKIETNKNSDEEAREPHALSEYRKSMTLVLQVLMDHFQNFARRDNLDHLVSRQGPKELHFELVYAVFIDHVDSIIQTIKRDSENIKDLELREKSPSVQLQVMFFHPVNFRTTFQNNRDYFEMLKKSQDFSIERIIRMSLFPILFKAGYSEKYWPGLALVLHFDELFGLSQDVSVNRFIDGKFSSIFLVALSNGTPNPNENLMVQRVWQLSQRLSERTSNIRGAMETLFFDFVRWFLKQEGIRFSTSTLDFLRKNVREYEGIVAEISSTFPTGEIKEGNLKELVTETKLHLLSVQNLNAALAAFDHDLSVERTADLLYKIAVLFRNDETL